ncbi:phospholipid hydroperoxide glutathione peroxidase-like [Chelonus insularis]|uniref:phospholipid hydroperoxide glutathione peroxidase-like n=1 Tax=Chelonus insularis TaxID=460826 RepID=UPI00158ABB02|nr:phospholipid hydroperoxide glutathione peroxidase-like [Chelonus insularis]XP_034942919.1 phospholipid hydroperoxide glutathione peroxidase-like [Chelonus insularis]
MLLKIFLFVSSISLIATAELCENGKDDHCMALDSPQSTFNQETDWNKADSIYQFHAKNIIGEDISLDKYRGHVMIIVNVASECGLTDTNYKQLVDLHRKYGKSKGLKILAFPSNEFGGQEPKSNEEIFKFSKGYNVEFDMYSKIKVNGEDAHPLWKWLKSKKSGLIIDAIKWNFTKFIIDKNGQVVERFSPTTEPVAMENDLKKYF